MVHLLRGLAILLEVLNSVPSTHRVTQIIETLVSWHSVASCDM